jgi:hypothetical protein
MSQDARLSPRSPGFAPGSVCMGFLVDTVALGQVFLRVRFCPVNVIPCLLRTHLSQPHEVCDSPDQAAHYHALGPKLGASSLTRHLAGKKERSRPIRYKTALLWWLPGITFPCTFNAVSHTKFLHLVYIYRVCSSVDHLPTLVHSLILSTSE